jgi:hypothetical protein
MKKSELKAKAAHYTKLVEWSDEDGCFVGSGAAAHRPVLPRER